MDVTEYLRQYTSDKKQKGGSISFKLKCTCGCEAFYVVKNSRTPQEARMQKEYEEKLPNTGWHSIYGGLDANGEPYYYIKRFFFFKKRIMLPKEPVFMGIHAIKAICSRCQKEIAVFDSRYNGYDSQFATEEQKAYVPHFENSNEKAGNIKIVMEQCDGAEDFSRIQVFVSDGDKSHKFFDAETG